MRNLLHIPFVKKFILVYMFSVILVFVYLIIRSIFFEEKEIEYKSFDQSKESIKQDSSVKEEKEIKAKIILLQ